MRSGDGKSTEHKGNAVRKRCRCTEFVAARPRENVRKDAKKLREGGGEGNKVAADTEVLAGQSVGILLQFQVAKKFTTWGCA